MEYGTMMKEARDNAKINFYQNPGYHFERQKNKTITINITNDELDNVTNTFSLEEPLRVDKLSDIYIDSFISNGIPERVNPLSGAEPAVVEAGTQIFVLGIKEFNIQSVSNKNVYHNKLIIPNTAKDGPTPHRATKFNYIGTINPSTLSSLEISLTQDDGITAIGKGDGSLIAQREFWITFMIVARD